jgi:hypothetical protein
MNGVGGFDVCFFVRSNFGEALGSIHTNDVHDWVMAIEMSSLVGYIQRQDIRCMKIR